MGLGIIELVIVGYMLSMSGGYGIPLGTPAGLEDPYLHQVAPEDCVMYIAWSGSAELDPDANAMEKWLAQKEILAFTEKLRLQGQRKINEFEKGELTNEAYFSLAMKLPELVMTQPGCFYVDDLRFANDRWQLAASGAYVINLGERRDEIEALVSRITEVPEPDFDQPGSHLFSLLTASTMGIAPDRKIAVHGNYLVIAFAGAGMELSTEKPAEYAKAGQPNWLKELKRKLPVQRRSSLSMLNTVRLNSALDQPNNADLTRVLNRLGRNDLTRIGWATGANENGYLCRTAVDCTDELNSVLSIFDTRPLDRGRLKGIPDDADFAFATRVSTEALYDVIAGFAADIGNRQSFEDSIAEFEAFSGITLKEDLLNNLDDYGFFFGDFQINIDESLVFGIGIRDDMAFLDTLHNFNERIDEVLVANRQLDLEVEVVNEIEIHTVVRDAGLFGWFNSVSWAHVGSELLISFSPERLKQVILEREESTPFVESQEGSRLFEFSKRADSEGPIGLMKFDMNRLLRVIEPYWRMVDVDYRIHPDLDITFGDIPDFKVLRNGMKPHVTGMYRTPGGFQMVQQQVMPGGSLISNIAFSGIASMTDAELSRAELDFGPKPTQARKAEPAFVD